MTTETLERRVIKAQVSRTPTDGRGTFDFEVHPFEIDLDNERIKNFTNVGPGRGASVPVDYQHTLEEIDPGGTIGIAKVAQPGDSLAGTVKLDIESNPMAMAVYERLLLPEGDPLRLAEVSIFYAFEPAKAFKGEKGELVQVDCELLGLAVVHKGAQRTAIHNVKNATPIGTATIDVVPHFVGPFAEWLQGQTVTAGADWTYDMESLVTKAGRVLSQKNESKLRQATDLLNQVLESVGMTSAEESAKETANAEEPEGANAEEPTPEPETPDARAQWADLLARLGREGAR